MNCSCPNCGIELPADYKRVKPQRVRLRTQCMPALRLLVESNRGLTAKELSLYFDDPMVRQDIEDHFTTLRFWRLIRKDGEKCYAEERGKLWVAGRFTIPECVYTVNGMPVEPPENAPEIARVFFEDKCPPPPATKEEESPAAIQQSLLAA